jgi:3,4-dihydroxy-9,10-secoandrosta-1,3,5(10)-triene-9,17-dione 4,5-dioxygenase
MKLHGLGYIGFVAPDPAAWLGFGTKVLGLMPARALPGEDFGLMGPGPASGGTGVAPDGSVYLKMDERQWRIAIHQGDAPGVAYLGFQVADEVALVQAMDEVAAAGVAIEVGSAKEAGARGVQGLAWCSDPSGNRVELFYGPVNDLGFVSPHGAGFLTGSLGLGHALLFAADVDASLAFYRNALGFRRSDFITVGPGMTLHFLRCTPRHHSIGLAHFGPFNGIHHLMLEMTTLDAVGAALDRANDAGVAITSTLGRHVNDRTVSFYMRGPSGFEVEIGFDGVLVDDATWCDHEVAGKEPWGHKGITPEGLEKYGQSLA